MIEPCDLLCVKFLKFVCKLIWQYVENDKTNNKLSYCKQAINIVAKYFCIEVGLYINLVL